MRRFQKLLALTYLAGAILHALDIFGLRLDFSSMTKLWRLWTIYLIVADLITALGLWKHRCWGELAFLIVALSQMIAYIGFKNIFGEQPFLIGFHSVTIAAYTWLKIKSHSKSH